jgi:hypothetical protein
MDCLAREPRPHWECDDDGMPAIKDGYCTAQQAALAGCLQRELR